MTLSKQDAWHVSTQCHIPATPEDVWAVLTDFSAYPAWNPFVRSIAGELRTGARLKVQIAPPGQRPVSLQPRVMTVDCGLELRWRGHILVPGVLDGDHQFYLEPDDGGGTIFHHRERFSGLLARLFLTPTALGRVTAGFEAMNVALCDQVTAKGSRA